MTGNWKDYLKRYMASEEEEIPLYECMAEMAPTCELKHIIKHMAMAEKGEKERMGMACQMDDPCPTGPIVGGPCPKPGKPCPDMGPDYGHKPGYKPGYDPGCDPGYKPGWDGADPIYPPAYPYGEDDQKKNK